MIKPFQIVWELIEFGIQALFVYVFAIIILIGLLVITIKDHSPVKHIEYIQIGQGSMAEGKECTRPAGCRILEDGTIEW
jgi:hypothetical protein